MTEPASTQPRSTTKQQVAVVWLFLLVIGAVGVTLAAGWLGVRVLAVVFVVSMTVWALSTLMAAADKIDR